MSYTLLDYVKIFADGLDTMLVEKCAQLNTVLETKRSMLKFEQGLSLARLRESLDKHNIPFSERELYSDLVLMFVGNGHKADIAKYESELANIKRAQRLIKRDAPSGNLNVAQAKDYPIADLFPSKLKKSGNRFLGVCPFHDDHSPSLVVYPDNHFCCFGCGKHGDSIAFLMELERINFVDATRRLN